MYLKILILCYIFPMRLNIYKEENQMKYRDPPQTICCA